MGGRGTKGSSPFAMISIERLADTSGHSPMRWSRFVKKVLGRRGRRGPVTNTFVTTTGLCQ